MGYDVSYHPIKESEMKEWYFERIEEVLSGDERRLRKVISENISDDCFSDDWLRLIHKADKYPEEFPFEISHGFAVACIQGYVRDYYYTRGCAFSILKDDPFFGSCCKDWEDILEDSIERSVYNYIFENYSSGVYISSAGVVRILEKLKSKDRQVVDKLLEVFGEDNLEVFVDALKASAALGAGLLEATDVVEPNPLDLRMTSCVSNLLNCDIKGVEVYRKIALEQFSRAVALDKD